MITKRYSKGKISLKNFVNGPTKITAKRVWKRSRSKLRNMSLFATLGRSNC
jgi:hypothetical protein